jgi:hypothetical protein
MAYIVDIGQKQDCNPAGQTLNPITACLAGSDLIIKVVEFQKD